MTDPTRPKWWPRNEEEARVLYGRLTFRSFIFRLITAALICLVIIFGPPVVALRLAVLTALHNGEAKNLFWLLLLIVVTGLYFEGMLRVCFGQPDGQWFGDILLTQLIELIFHVPGSAWRLKQLNQDFPGTDER